MQGPNWSPQWEPLFNASNYLCICELYLGSRALTWYPVINCGYLCGLDVQFLFILYIMENVFLYTKFDIAWVNFNFDPNRSFIYMSIILVKIFRLNYHIFLYPILGMKYYFCMIFFKLSFNELNFILYIC